MNIFRIEFSSMVAIIEKAQVLNKARLSQGHKKERIHTPAGIIHSSLLYDNDFAGETRGSRAVRAVVIRSDSFKIATFFPQRSNIC